MTIGTFSVDGYSARLYRSANLPEPGSGISAPSGVPVVYLHSGFGEFGELPLFSSLEARGLSVFAPEMAGFGYSEPINDWHHLSDVVFYLRRVLDTLGVARAVLLGSSLGGWLAAELAVWFPERVAGLVLLDALGLYVEGSPVFELFGAPLDQLVERVLPNGGDLMELLAPAIAGDTDPNAPLVHFLRAFDRFALIGWNPFLHDPKLAQRLEVVASPTLVLWGRRDGIVPLVHGSAYADALAGARLEVIEDCGHLPALERPEVVAVSLSAWLSAWAGDPGPS